MAAHYELRCRQCGRTYENAPRTICDDCFSPLDVSYDLDFVRSRFTRDAIAQRPRNIWRYAELLPIPENHPRDLPTGCTPLLQAPCLGARIGSRHLYVKNDAVNFPTLSFKDRVVAIAAAQCKAFGFRVIACSSTGNLGNAVAAQAVRNGLEAWVFVPAGLEAAKIAATQVYGARIIAINGSYDHVSRLCTQIAENYPWGFVNVNLRAYYAEGSKTLGFEIAEQLGWRLPDNIVGPMASGSQLIKIHKAFSELIALGLVEPKNVRFFGAQAAGCSPISTLVKSGGEELQPQRPNTICKSLAIGNPADGLYAAEKIRASGGWAEDAGDTELVAAARLLAETEGVFTETAGGVTVAVAKKLIAQGRIHPDETTVLIISGNGLKTTEMLAGEFAPPPVIEPKTAAFEAFVAEATAAAAKSARGGA